MQQLPLDYGRGGCAAHDESHGIYDCKVNEAGECANWCYVAEDCAAEDVIASTIIPGNFYSYLNCGNDVVVDDMPVDDMTGDMSGS
jgi:hypothetical protein